MKEIAVSELQTVRLFSQKRQKKRYVLKNIHQNLAHMCFLECEIKCNEVGGELVSSLQIDGLQSSFGTFDSGLSC